MTIREVHLVQGRKRPSLDRTQVLVEVRSGNGDQATRAVQAALLTAHIKNNIRISAEVIINDPGMVERSAGKGRRIIDLRATD